METQFVTDVQGNKTAAIIPFEEWERTEKAKDILEMSILPIVFWTLQSYILKVTRNIHIIARKMMVMV
ncbi:hypothetical protein [Desulfobacula sp.]